MSLFVLEISGFGTNSSNPMHMAQIDPAREYTIQEVADSGFIPHVETYSKVYNLITVGVPDEENQLKKTRVPATETSTDKIKAINPKPWGKISGKLLVKGEEIIKFLDIHNLR